MQINSRRDWLKSYWLGHPILPLHVGKTKLKGRPVLLAGNKVVAVVQGDETLAEAIAYACNISPHVAKDRAREP